ncbi:hypothetical protein [Salipiger sp.]|uniref:hypothetical protein n=1 Tax=Salipiger sp. TaxID=2078585 RepID=UPI003A96F7AB
MLSIIRDRGRFRSPPRFRNHRRMNTDRGLDVAVLLLSYGVIVGMLFAIVF